MLHWTSFFGMLISLIKELIVFIANLHVVWCRYILIILREPSSNMCEMTQYYWKLLAIYFSGLSLQLSMANARLGSPEYRPFGPASVFPPNNIFSILTRKKYCQNLRAHHWKIWLTIFNNIVSFHISPTNIWRRFPQNY